MKKIRRKLAIFGGDPIIPSGRVQRSLWPIVDRRDMEAVKKVLKNRDFLNRNSKSISALEDALARYIGVKHCLLFSSGTAALHACLVGCGVGEGDEVIVPAYTFCSSAMAIIHAGAKPVFCDIDPMTYNIDPLALKIKITKRTKAVVVVHLYGLPANMEAIQKAVSGRDLFIIEDCAQSFGASIGDIFCGAMGDVSAHSFMPSKQLAGCGELGAIMTPKLEIRNRSNLTRLYGDRLKKSGKKEIWPYTLGYNYHPNAIQAEFLAQKFLQFKTTMVNVIAGAEKLSNFLRSEVPQLIPPYVPEGYKHVYHFFRIRINADAVNAIDVGLVRWAVMKALMAEGLGTRYYQTLIIPQLPYFAEKKTCDIERFPGSIRAIRESFAIGSIGSAPQYLLSKASVKAYMRGFTKIRDNWQEILQFADYERKHYREPWEELIGLSDTVGTFFKPSRGRKIKT